MVDEIRLPPTSNLDNALQPALDELFEGLNRARILTLVREGPWGSTGINQFLVHELRRQIRRTEPSDNSPNRLDRSGLFEGAPLLVTRNDYHHQLFNGDVGLVLRTSSGGHRAVFQRMGSYFALPLDALPVHELAFAMTVHKAQGSEYDQVLLVLPPQGGQRLLTKEMLYTGITRARQLAVIAGSADLVRTAIRRRVQREANLLQ